MSVLSRKAGPFFAWQLATLIAAFAAAAGGGFVLARSADSTTSVGLAEGEQLVVASVGALVDSISTSGTVVFPNRESAAFDIAGEVAEVFVAEGDVVTEGQPLATIDDSTKAALAMAVAEAEVKLRDAREALDDALDEALTDPDAIALAEAEVDLARVELADAEEELAEARADANALDIELVRADVVVREQTLATAKAELANLTLTAPIAGVVETVGMEPGDRADQASAMIEIVNPSIIRETAAFDIAGKVAAVFVAEGDRVTAGQELAVVDDPTIAALEKAIADAEVKARDASEALASALAGPDAVAAAKAAETAAQARIALREAEDALADLSEATPAEVAEAQADVGAAAEALSNAQADLAAANQDAAEDVSDAQDVVTDAEDAYAETFRRWLGIRLTESELNVDPATLLTGWGADLDALFSDQSPLRGDSGVIDVPDNDPATPWNEATLYSWLTLFPGAVAGTCDDDEVLFQVACAEREMNDAWAGLVDARDALSTTVVAASRSGLSAEAAIAKAEDDLAAAEDAMAALLSPDPLDLAAAAADVALAQAELAGADAALAEALAGGDALEIRLLRTEVTVAEEALTTAREDLAGAALVAPISGLVETVAMEPGDQANQTPVLIELVDIAADEAESETIAFGIAGEVGEVFVAEGDAVTVGQALAVLDDLTKASLEKAVADAEVKLRDAQDDLQSLLTPDQLGLAAAAVDAARARTKLADAEDALAEALEGVEADELTVELLRTELAVAEQALVTAKEELAGATLTAPIAGVVETVSMEPGDRANQASGQSAAQIDLVDTSVVEIDGAVDEIDVLAIREGMQATVSMTALAGQTLTGTISDIGTAEAGQSGVVTFPLAIRVDVPEGVALREGLSATSEIVLDQFTDVLLVPTSSITGSFVAPTVRVSAGGIIEERAVALGPSNDFWVVVLDGLTAGDQVVMPEPASAGAQFGGFGAVFGGGGGGRRALRGGGGGGG